MATYNFIQLDVFTETPFAGNPLAVFPEAEGISDDAMMKIAREMNLSETVFVLPAKSDEVLRKLRIFTPAREIPFAGHPIVGTWNVLAREGVVPVPEGGNGWTQIHQEVGIGILPVDIEFVNGQPVRVVMTQGKFEIVDEIEDGEEQVQLARALGRNREDLDESLPIQVISTGLSFLAVPIRSLADVRDCRVDASLLADIYTRRGGTGCLVFTRETLEVGDSRVHARMFAPADNIPEDPATGSACGALGGYMVHHGALALEPDGGSSRSAVAGGGDSVPSAVADGQPSTYKFVIEQGDFIHRPSRISLEVTGKPGDVQKVKIGGPSVIVARGEVYV